MSLAGLLGLGDRELIALVGGGGKSTMLFDLGEELARAGEKVILTTTTKMGRDQAMLAPTVCWSADTQCAKDAVENDGPVMLVTGGDDHKVTGPPPELIDTLFEAGSADYIIVEADGSRGRPLKAPASWEPVVPSRTSTVVILMGVDAVGHPIRDVVHRVELGERFLDTTSDHVLTAADCASVLLHPGGALRVCPPTAKVVVAITKATTPKRLAHAEEIGRLIEPRVTAVVVPASKQL